MLVLKTRKTSNSGIVTSEGTLLAANPARVSYKIQNLGQNPLFVREGSGASVSNFDYILAAGTVNDDGKGASYDSPEGQCYVGIITIAGTSPRAVGSYREENAN